tara:strand:+ start:115 stop:741 length:627 start_codon:yes stop_codon:yes gene_type:complete
MQMSSPYLTTKMADTIELVTRENCKSYDLYISSELRRSMFMTGAFKDDVSTLRVSILNMMYKTAPERYNEIIENFKNQAEKTKMLFLGVSNDAGVFIVKGQLILDTVNSYLESYVQGARVRRIVLTNEIDEKSPPKCYPMKPGGLVGTSNSYKFKPNNNPPPDSFAWENHLAEYYVDKTDLWYNPSEVVANIETVIDGKKVCANVVEN